MKKKSAGSRQIFPPRSGHAIFPYECKGKSFSTAANFRPTNRRRYRVSGFFRKARYATKVKAGNARQIEPVRARPA